MSFVAIKIKGTSVESAWLHKYTSRYLATGTPQKSAGTDDSRMGTVKMRVLDDILQVYSQNLLKV